MLPFGNATVIETLTYAQLVAALAERLQPPCGDPSVGTGRTPQFSGLKVEFHCTGTSPVIDNVWLGRRGSAAADAARPDGHRPHRHQRLHVQRWRRLHGVPGGTNVLQTGDLLLDVLDRVHQGQFAGLGSGRRPHRPQPEHVTAAAAPPAAGGAAASALIQLAPDGRDPHEPRRLLRAAGLVDRPREAARPLPAAGARARAVADRSGLPGGGARRRDAAGDRRPGARRAGHHHRRRDAARELLEPLRDRARGRRHRQPGHGAGPQRASRTRCRAWSARSSASTPSRCATSSSCARTRQPHGEDDRAGAVHDVPAGAERLLRRSRRRWAWPTPTPCARRSSTCSRPAPTSCRSTSRTCRRAPSRRASTGSPPSSAPPTGCRGTTAVHICFGYAAIIHERPSGYSFLPELAETDCDQVSIETGAVRARPRGARLAAGQDDHPRRARPLDRRGGDAPRRWRSGSGARSRTRRT